MRSRKPAWPRLGGHAAFRIILLCSGKKIVDSPINQQVASLRRSETFRIILLKKLLTLPLISKLPRLGGQATVRIIQLCSGKFLPVPLNC
jgi:hypothetical protein